jgi:hypothetical protein
MAGLGILRHGTGSPPVSAIATDDLTTMAMDARTSRAATRAGHGMAGMTGAASDR